MRYSEFLAHKSLVSPPTGIDGEIELNPKLFGFQRDIVAWALRRGRAAIFADCGMGKAFMALEWSRVVSEKTGSRVLILTPLAVAKQTIREGAKFGIESQYARNQAEAGDASIVVTNYERLVAFDTSLFDAVVIDESGILKDFAGKTRNTIVDLFARTPYRLSCTATPAPNDYMELGNQCEFLGILTRAEMLSTFFVHDGGNTSQWRLKGHAEKEYWKWMASWATAIRKPSDLGYDDGPFRLPELRVHEHVVATGKAPDGYLFAVSANGLQEQRQARRATLNERVKLVTDIVMKQPGSWLIWCELNDEGDALTRAIPGAVQIAGSDPIEQKEENLLRFADGLIQVLISKPSIAGHGMNFQKCHRQAFVGMSNSYEQYYQAIRRSWRFGQTREVDIHAVTSDLETGIWENVKRKEADAVRMSEEMVAAMKEESQRQIRRATRENTEYKPTKRIVVPDWMVTE